MFVPPFLQRWILLNTIRILTIVSCTLVIASTIQTLKRNFSQYPTTKTSGGYFTGTDIPTSFLGVFWSTLHHIYLITILFLVIFSELSLPIPALHRLFKSSLPFLGPNWGTGFLGALQILLAADVLSRPNKTKFQLVSSWIMASTGILNVGTGVIWRAKGKLLRSPMAWKAEIADKMEKLAEAKAKAEKISDSLPIPVLTRDNVGDKGKEQAKGLFRFVRKAFDGLADLSKAQRESSEKQLNEKASDAEVGAQSRFIPPLPSALAAMRQAPAPEQERMPMPATTPPIPIPTVPIPAAATPPAHSTKETTLMPAAIPFRTISPSVSSSSSAPSRSGSPWISSAIPLPLSRAYSPLSGYSVRASSPHTEDESRSGSMLKKHRHLVTRRNSQSSVYDSSCGSSSSDREETLRSPPYTSEHNAKEDGSFTLVYPPKTSTPKKPKQQQRSDTSTTTTSSSVEKIVRFRTPSCLTQNVHIRPSSDRSSLSSDQSELVRHLSPPRSNGTSKATEKSSLLLQVPQNQPPPSSSPSDTLLEPQRSPSVQASLKAAILEAEAKARSQKAKKSIYLGSNRWFLEWQQQQQQQQQSQASQASSDVPDSSDEALSEAGADASGHGALGDRDHTRTRKRLSDPGTNSVTSGFYATQNGKQKNVKRRTSKLGHQRGYESDWESPPPPPPLPIAPAAATISTATTSTLTQETITRPSPAKNKPKDRAYDFL